MTATRGRHPGDWRLVAVAAMVVWLGVFAWAMARTDYDVWGTLLVGPLLVLVSVPWLRRAVAREAGGAAGTIIVVGFALKMVMAFVNHAVAFGLYGGIADARGYHRAGVDYAASFWSGHLELAQQGELGRRFINGLAGVVYTVTGPTKLGGYLVFSWLAFWGLYLLYRAFVTAVPDGDRRRYAVLVLLLPSTLFWTSAIGKEAWMTLTIGTFSLGAANLLTGKRWGLPLVGLGLAGAAACRPHVGLLLLAALLVAYVCRRRPRPAVPSAPLATVAMVSVLLVMGLLAADRFAHHFDLDSFGPGDVGAAIERAERQSGGGGSEFTSQHLPWPLAAGSVLFRPFPHEARNLAGFLAAVEGLVMLGLFVAARRRLGAALRRLRANPYLLYCAVYTVLFLVAFSSFRNFGTLARERVQVVPMVLALFAVPVPMPVTERRRYRTERRALVAR